MGASIQMNTEMNVMQVRSMIDADKRNSTEAGHKKVQYRQETKNSAIQLSQQYQGVMRSLSEELNIDLGTLYTWRYKAGLSNFEKRPSAAPRKAKPKTANGKLMQRLKSQVQQHQDDIVKLNKQLELVRLADELGMQIDFD